MSNPKWTAVSERTEGDNFHTSIYEEGYDGLLVARCNQNGQHPWQAPAIINALTANKAVPLSDAAAEITRLEAANEELIRGMTEMAERFTAVMAPYLPRA